MTEITTRKALEVVLSRCPMDKHTAERLCYQLYMEIKRYEGTDAPTAIGGAPDLDELRAGVRVVIDDLQRERRQLSRAGAHEALRTGARDLGKLL